MCSDIWKKHVLTFRKGHTLQKFLPHKLSSFQYSSLSCRSSSHFAPPRNVWQMLARCTCQAFKFHWLQWNTSLSWKWCCRDSSREKVNSFFMTLWLLWLYHLLANICLYWMPPLGDSWSMCALQHTPFCLRSSFIPSLEQQGRQRNLFIWQGTANNPCPPGWDECVKLFLKGLLLLRDIGYIFTPPPHPKKPLFCFSHIYKQRG